MYFKMYVKFKDRINIHIKWLLKAPIFRMHSWLSAPQAKITSLTLYIST